ncbi:hypothetical protein BKA93DRAFT_404196 [Sparassis latifolia]
MNVCSDPMLKELCQDSECGPALDGHDRSQTYWTTLLVTVQTPPLFRSTHAVRLKPSNLRSRIQELLHYPFACISQKYASKCTLPYHYSTVVSMPHSRNGPVEVSNRQMARPKRCVIRRMDTMPRRNDVLARSDSQAFYNMPVASQLKWVIRGICGVITANQSRGSAKCADEWSPG